MSWRGQGRRAKGRRGDQDADLDNTAWLEELEKAAAEQDDDEEEWASKLRRRRSQEPEPPTTAPDPPGPAPELPRAPVAHDLSPYPPLGSEPAPPPPPPPSRPAPGPAREPDYRLLGMEPDTRPQDGDWDAGWDAGSSARDGPAADWATPDPSPSAPGSAGDAATDWPAWEPEGSQEPRRPLGRDPVSRDGYDLGEPDWRPAGPDAATGAWSPAEPVGREPDYPALFGELNRRSAAQREALWDASAAPAPEPYEEPGSPDPPAPAWPFEETTGTWEPSDRSFIWPAEELPATSTEWEPSTPSWLDEPTTQPPTWQDAPADTAPPASPPPVAPDDWAAGIQSGVPPAAPAGRAGDVAARRWRPDEAVYAEPAVPLGANGMAPPRSAADHIQMAEPADHWELYEERPRARWPKVVAIVSWIVLLMVVCWFYVFPWLEQVLPENF